MIDIKYLRENTDLVKQKVATKGESFDVQIDRLLVLDAELRELNQVIEKLNAERNQVAAQGQEGATRGREIKEELKPLNERQAALEEEVAGLAKQIPNIPMDSVPVGPDESGNVVVRQVGERPSFAFEPKPHWELGERLGIIDNERGAKVAGSRFTYLKGRLALLQFALIQYVFRIVTSEEVLAGIIAKAGIELPATPFLPVIPPVMIRPDVMERMARLEPKEQRYHTAADDLYLVGSAEHTLGPLHMDETLQAAQMPIRYIGYSTAFRREAGTYGKDMKGILRVHQFDKLEMETFSTGETAEAEQDLLIAIQEHIMQGLGLPYQVVSICTGDMGGPDARQFDIETWMPGQNAYRETHTADLMSDYQARRLNTRVKKESGTEFAHMNDATAVAIGRTLIAIMENYQHEDGTIRVPEVLVPYCGFEVID